MYIWNFSFVSDSQSSNRIRIYIIYLCAMYIVVVVVVVVAVFVVFNRSKIIDSPICFINLKDKSLCYGGKKNKQYLATNKNWRKEQAN